MLGPVGFPQITTNKRVAGPLAFHTLEAKYTCFAKLGLSGVELARHLYSVSHTQSPTLRHSLRAHRCSPPPVATCRPGRCGRGCINMLASRVHTEKSDTCRPVGFPRAGIHLATPRVISAIQILCEPHAQEPWHKCKFALPWVSENTRWKTPWEHQEINKVMKKRVAIEMCTSTRFISCSSWHVPDAMCQRRAWKSTVRQISSSKYRLHTYLTVLTQ